MSDRATWIAFVVWVLATAALIALAVLDAPAPPAGSAAREGMSVIRHEVDA